MNQKLRLLMMTLLCAVVSVAWGDTTYKLEQVTSVEAGGLYVFEQDGYVMTNTVSSKALQTTNSYKTTGLEGNESYVWTLETATNGFYLKNVSLSSNQYLNNSSSTDVSFGTKSSIWAFNFQTDNTVLIQNKSNSDRFLGYSTSTSHAYKAYATSNLSSSTYPHAIKVYKLVSTTTTTTPTLTVSPANITVPATGVTNGTLTLSSTGVDFSKTVKLYTHFYYDENGVNEIADNNDYPDWISINDSWAITATPFNVSYSVENNTEGERTAYIKLVYIVEYEDEDGGLDNADPIYSNVITVTQEAVDYTTLPFTYDNGKDGISTTIGLSQNGLASDYANSPYLKFDSSNDELILHFNERPGTLSYDIQGNGFSGGTFQVLYSENGEDFTVLKNYTELSGSVKSEEFDNLGENVRYIKWLYKQKSSGNVGLGNIKLEKYVTPQPYTLTITPNDNAEIFVFYNNSENTPIENGGQVLAGSEVLVSVSANEGYQIEGVTVTNGEGRAVALTEVEGEEGTAWTFYMPRSNVTVACTTYAIPTIAATRSQATGSVVFTQGIVTSCVEKTAYIQDETAGICVYGNANLNLTVGDKIKVQGTLTNYNGLLEITSPTCTKVSSGNTVVPIVKTIAEISNDIQGMLVSIENATVTQIDGQSTTIKQGENSIIVRGITGVEYAVNDIISLTGNVGCFNAVQIANPRNVTISEELAPSIYVSPITINAGFEGETGELSIIANKTNTGRRVTCYEANGTTPVDQPTWFTYDFSTDGTALSYTIAENTGDARTLYFRIEAQSLSSPTEFIRSELVTVNQEAYVAPVATKTYVKVTSTNDITDGNYLIVYEEGSVAFDGSLETLDATGNTKSVTLDNNKIETNEGIYFTFEEINNGSGYIKSATGHYIGFEKWDNGLKQTDDPKAKAGYYNAISFDSNGNVLMSLSFDSGNIILNYNSNSDQKRFRYFKNGSQKAIQLYKEVVEQPADESFTLTVSSAATDGKGSYYATMSAIGNGNFKVPEGVVASAITLNYNKKITQTAVFEGGKEGEDVLPGDGAYLIEVKDVTKSYTFTPTAEEASFEDFENWLYPATKDVLVTAPTGVDENDNYKFYQLSLDSNHTAGSVGFYYGPESASGDEGGQPFMFGSDHKAYLAVPRNLGTSASISLFDGIEDTDGINGITASERSERGVYTLTGVRVDNKNLPKGIYIVNGKKQVVK